MAHADFHCCAVCDKKLSYDGVAATTKEEICKECRRSLRELGIPAANVGALIAWMRDNPSARSMLDEIGFKKCFYANLVDQTYEAMTYEKRSAG